MELQEAFGVVRKAAEETPMNKASHKLVEQALMMIHDKLFGGDQNAKESKKTGEEKAS